MKLKSGCIFWPQVDPDNPLPSEKLLRDVRCDVAVIGGGISGALAAYHLARNDVDVVMVDRRRVAAGSTVASTGLLQYEIDAPLTDLIAKLGRKRAEAAYRASLESLLAFEPLVAQLGDRCGLIACPSLYLASHERDVEALREECEARRAMQIEVRFLSGDELKAEFGLSGPAALLSARAFEVDPYRLTRQLVRRSIERGMRLFDQTQVDRYEADGELAMLHCATGTKIIARKVVIAMGYETMGLLPPDFCKLTSTYALASEPMKNFGAWRDRCLIWETARPYLYARSTEDDRVMVGGEDEDIVDPQLRDSLLEQKVSTLLRRFSEWFPHLTLETTCGWAGTFAQTPDGLPYIGTLPQYPHCYFALGYGGNGITFSLLAAEIIRDAFLARPNKNAELFGFGRRSWR